MYEDRCMKVLEEIAGCDVTDKVFVSIVAGVSVKEIKGILGENAKFVSDILANATPNI